MTSSPAVARPSPSPAGPSGFPGTMAAVALLGLALLGAYGATAGAPFVYDDVEAILDNPTIRSLWPLGPVLQPDLPGGVTVSGRPLLNLSLALNYALSGTNPWSYHAGNLLIHFAGTLALWGIARRLLPRVLASSDRSAEPLALLIAGLWALHPLQTQAVTYTVQRAESLAGLGAWLTLYAFLRSVESSSSRRWQAVAVIACLGAAASKETAVTIPLLVLACDRTFVAGSFLAAGRARPGLYLGLAASWIVVALLVASTGGNRGGTVGLGVGQPLWAYPLTQFQAVAHYLRLALWPQPLVFEHGTFWVERAGDILPSAAVVLPLLGVTVWALRRHPAAGFLGAWFFVLLAPTSLAPGTIQMIVEHRMYLPLAALIAGFVVGLHHLLGRHTLLLGLAAGLGIGGVTLARNHDYRSAIALWSATVAARPDNPRAQSGLAEAYAAAGRLEEALPHHREAVRLLPDEARYHYNLGHTLARAGRRAEAMLAYRQALRLAPEDARTHNNLALLLTQDGAGEAALPHYATARRLQPRDPLYAYNAGVALARLDRPQEAAAAFTQALQLRPDYADAHFNLGSAHMALGQLDEALRHYREACRLQPADADYRVALAGALQLAGQSEAALTEYATLLSAHPDSAAALFGRGNALATLRRTDDAVASYEAALRLRPDHADAHFKLGNVLMSADRVLSAVPHYEAALRLRPTDAEAQHNLGVAFARLARYAEARQAFEAALRLRPDYPEAQRNLAQVRALSP